MVSEETDGSPPATLNPQLPSHKDVAYSCGSCGYALNLHSSSRNTSNIDSNYRKALKKGIVSFVAIDDSRFGHVDETNCFRRRTKLVCRKCGRRAQCRGTGSCNEIRHQDLRAAAVRYSSLATTKSRSNGLVVSVSVSSTLFV